MSSQSNSDLESQETPSPPPPRANRFNGPPSTYYTLTAPERGLATSLDEIRAQNLSIHLYNAHALKKRALRFWERKENGEIFDEEGEGMGWTPPKVWTAWPLPPERVPREGETVGEDDGSEAFTLRRKGERDEGCSDLLEEILVGRTLKFAGERFERRQWARKDDGSGREGNDADVEEIDHVSYISDEEMGGYTPPSGQPEALDADDEEAVEPVIKNHSQSPEPEPFLKPILSADDERSTTLLRPSIRHAMTQLDTLLAALHHSRKPCHNFISRSAPNTSDESRPASDTEGSIPASTKRSVGRPRKLANLTILPKADNTLATGPDSADLFLAKKTHLGRPKKVYPRLEGESQQDFLIRIARLQKKPLPSFASAPPSPSPRSPSMRSARSASVASTHSRKSPARRMTDEELKDSRLKKLGLRDWSEIMGAAALVGFSPDVVARATQRCADLFGEGMTMLNLPERPFSANNEDTFTTYQPQLFPDLSSEDDLQTTDDDEDVKCAPISRKRKAGDSAKSSWFCPIEDCRRATEGFIQLYLLKRHMKRVHSFDKEEIEEFLDKREHMAGAVHVDGYLQVMRQGLGRGRGHGVKRVKGAGRKESTQDSKETSSEDSDGESLNGDTGDGASGSSDEDTGSGVS